MKLCLQQHIPIILKTIIPGILLFLYGTNAVAQDNQQANLRNIISSITSYTNRLPAEKLYLQTDKPSYNAGDTLWFKAYLFNAAYLSASSESGLLYVEIANDRNIVVKRVMVSLYDGLGWGDIPLSEKEFPQGIYTLSAYTNWMRNFGESYMFRRQFAINELSGEAWLVNSRFSITKEGNRQTAATTLQLNQLNKEPVIARQLQVQLTEGSRVWYKNQFRTGADGTLDFNFRIPEKADPGKLAITIKDLTEENGTELYVPVVLHRDELTDLQFMPEGGNLVAGIKSRVAFKAISEDGKGCDITGTIYNSRQQVISSFTSSHLGMGSFYLVPQAGETYSALVKFRDGKTATYPLPAVKSTGIVLQVINAFNSDSLEINIMPGSGLQNDTSRYYLVGQSRGIGCFGAIVVLNSRSRTFRISKNIFPTGVARLTLLNADKQPLNERAVFVDHHDLLDMDIRYRQHYATRDSVMMEISVADKTGAPVQGSFSVAVTDDAQVNIDTVKNNSLVSNILLTSALKGFVEDPGYYFQPVMTEKTWDDMDNLLLTQGWTGYSWENIFAPVKPAQYKGQQSFSVTGKVTNILNKPVAGSQVVLFSKKPVAFMEAVTGQSGGFAFNDLYPVDTAEYMIQARNKKGKSFNVGIEVDEFKPPVLSPLQDRMIPWYVNIDTTSLNIVHTQVANKDEVRKIRGKYVLREVIVTGKKVVKGSKNLNGPGEADLTLDQSEMEKEGKATLGNVLEQRVKGFRLGGKRLNVYLINTELVHLIIDGVNLDFFKPEGTSYKDFYKPYLDYITAEDVKGIEVMQSSKYAMPYFQKFINNPFASPFDHVFIEITTYSGNGAFMKKTPGVYLYKPPLAFSAPAQFYSPKYQVRADSNLIDVRSTIYWEPNVITNEEGKARISFYTADKPGTYTLIMEGSDMNGNIGSGRWKMTVQ